MNPILGKINDGVLTTASILAGEKDIENMPLVSALGGMTTLGLTLGAAKLLKRRVTPKIGMLAVLAGALSPIAHNGFTDLNRVTRSEGRKPTIEEIRGIMPGLEFNKTAGFAAKSAIGVGRTTKALASGLLPTPKNARFGEKVVGTVIKGVAGIGLVKGGIKAYKHLTKPTSTNDYTTYLRNSILAGKINSRELSKADMESVRELGMS